mmetsp:Transcript_36152/g.84628  ORF Transcript_36152/g.84628 Transcript_36152/m.84628 type:complete len:233 (-) Transcript_36152:768-1466(-)
MPEVLLDRAVHFVGRNPEPDFGEGPQLDGHQPKLHDLGGLPDWCGHRVRVDSVRRGMQRPEDSMESLEDLEVHASGLSLCVDLDFDQHGLLTRHECRVGIDHWKVLHSCGSYRCRMGVEEILHVVGVCGNRDPDASEHDFWISAGLQSWIKSRVGAEDQLAPGGHATGSGLLCCGGLQLPAHRAYPEGGRGPVPRTEGPPGCCMYNFHNGAHPPDRGYFFKSTGQSLGVETG